MSPQLAEVLVASAPGSGKANQDRVFATGNAVVLLDGASSVRKQTYDGGWYADRLGRLLANVIADNPTISLVQALACAIERVATTADLGDNPPSSTIAIARWQRDALDILVLGDSPAVVFHRDGTTRTVYDGRLDDVAVSFRDQYRARLREGGGFGAEHQRLLRHLQSAEQQARNRHDGYWIASADPTAAHHALNRTYALQRVAAVLLVTDGIAIGVTDYGQPASWDEARQHIENHGPCGLLRVVHDAEGADPHGRRWPRSKPHDDKTVALVRFTADPAAAP